MAESVVPGSEASKEGFQWALDGRVMVVDNGGAFVAGTGFAKYMDLGSFAVVAFDPANRLAARKGLEEIDELQLVSGSTLGDGQQLSFHACLEDTLSSTLEPLPGTLARQGPATLKVDPILARLPMASIRMDDIQGLPGVDWLILDALNDNIAILANGGKTLADTGLIEVQIPFQPTHAGQAGFGAVDSWMVAHGFRFCRFQNFALKSRFPADRYLEKTQASDMQVGTAVFVPIDERLDIMPTAALMKLSFLLHTVYKLHDVAYHVLQHADAELATRYLVAEGYLWPVDKKESEFTLTSAYSPDIWAH